MIDRKKCASYERLIYLYRELNNKETIELEQHLHSCPHCRKIFGVVQDLGERFGRSEVQTLENSAAFTHQVMDAITASKAKRSNMFLLPKLSIVKYSFAGMSFFLCIFFFYEHAATPGNVPRQMSNERGTIMLETHDFLQNARRNSASNLVSSCLRECGAQALTADCKKCQSKIKEIVSI